MYSLLLPILNSRPRLGLDGEGSPHRCRILRVQLNGKKPRWQDEGLGEAIIPRLLFINQSHFRKRYRVILLQRFKVNTSIRSQSSPILWVQCRERR
jgi:hypothetical protein